MGVHDVGSYCDTAVARGWLKGDLHEKAVGYPNIFDRRQCFLREVVPSLPNLACLYELLWKEGQHHVVIQLQAMEGTLKRKYNEDSNGSLKRGVEEEEEGMERGKRLKLESYIYTGSDEISRLVVKLPAELFKK